MKFLHKLILITLLFLSSCELNNHFDSDRDGIKGIGPVIDHQVDFNSFHHISNSLIANVIITVGGSQSVVIYAQQNIYDRMDNEVIGDQLILKFQDNSNFSEIQEITVEITVPNLSSLSAAGVANYVLNGPKQDRITITAEGVSNIDAYGLEVDVCTVNMEGVGNSKIMANQRIEGSLTGVTNVYYKGLATIALSTSGVSTVINEN